MLFMYANFIFMHLHISKNNNIVIISVILKGITPQYCIVWLQADTKLYLLYFGVNVL